MTCEQAISQAELLPLGLLEPGERAELEAHLGACAACRAASRALGAAWGAHLDEVERVTAAPIGAAARERALLAAVGAAAATEEGDVVGSTTKKQVVAPGPVVDPQRVEAVGKKIALGCSYCHARAEREEVVFCAACLAPHHAECFRAHGRCSLPGCEETGTVRPARLGPVARGGKRRALLSILGTMSVAAAISGVAAWRRNEAARQDRKLQEAQRQALEAEDAPAEREASRLAARRGPLVTLEVEGAPLEDVAAALGHQAGINLLVDPAVQETVSLSLREVPWREALAALASMTRCEVEDRGGGVWLLTQPPLVTIQHTDADVRAVLQLLAAYSGRNIVIGPEVQGRLVSPDLKDVRWDAALVTVAHAVGYRAWVVRSGAGTGPAQGSEVVYVGATAPQGGVLLEPGGGKRGAPDVVGRAISLDLEEATVGEACAGLARAAGVSVEVRGLSPDDPRRVSLQLRDAPWQQALHLLAERADCEVELGASGATVRPVVRLGRLQAAGIRLDELVALLGQVEAVREAGLNVVVDEDAGARAVTLDLRDVRPADALRGALALAGCERVDEQGAMRIRARPGSEHALIAPRPPVAMLALRAVVAEGTQPVWASISGRAVRVGARLADEDGGDLGELVSVEPGSARLRRSDGRTVKLVLGNASGVFELEPQQAEVPSLGLACQDEVPGEVRVEDVQAGSTAEAAGVRKGDLLLSLQVGGEAHELKRLEDLIAPLGGAPIGAPVTFVVRRGPETLRLSAPLGARPR